jgi:hypothetical protein
MMREELRDPYGSGWPAQEKVVAMGSTCSTNDVRKFYRKLEHSED